VDLKELTEKIVHEYQQVAKEKGLTLNWEPQVESAVIQADQYAVSEAVTHIIDNAVKYTEQGTVTVTLKQEGNQLILNVQDTGIGIAKKYLGQLFEAFSQESEGYTKKFQGLGLGLALTKRYLELNQARIEVQSAKGAGTTFTLVFKASKQRQPKGEPASPRKPLPEVTQTGSVPPAVLVVEDDINSQKLVKTILKDSYTPLFAVSVKEARKTLSEYEVDLVLLDLSLVGDEDGLDLVRYLRRSDQWKDLPVVALTAHAFESDRKNALNAGCDDYVTKPVIRTTLLEKIRRFA
jgi:CheY-like chemotaxis protein